MLRERVRPPARVVARPQHPTWTPGRRLAALAVLALAAVTVFLTVNVVGNWQFVLSLRTATVATMLLVGYAIAVSTVLFQTVTHNRILTPSIMGFDALYVLIQTVLVATLGAKRAAAVSEPVQFTVEVVVMVAFSGLLYRWLFLGQRRDLHLLVLAGVVLGVLFRSVATFMQRLMDPNEFAVLQDRFFASFTRVDESLLLAAVVAVLAVTVVGWRISHTFDVLALGREQAVSLGVDYRRTVTLVLVLIAVLVSVSTALVGPVAFLGLLVANLAYHLVGSERHRWTLPASVLIAVIALVGGQAILQHVFALETTLSIVIEFLGGMFFIVLLIKGARK